MVLVYSPTKLAHKNGVNVGKYSSTMERLGYPKRPKAVLFESLPLSWHKKGSSLRNHSNAEVLRPRVYSNECLAPMIHVKRS